MEVLIRVEVSTDTADPKITRQEVERVHGGNGEKDRGELRPFMTCADLLPCRTDSRERLRGQRTFFEDMTRLRMGVGTCDKKALLMIINESVMSVTCLSVLLWSCTMKHKP